MFGRKKEKRTNIEYDPDTQQAVIRCSICTGEQVAGFKEKGTGKFTDVCVIREEGDLEKFKETYGVEEIRKEY